jgi:hypothetical protein
LTRGDRCGSIVLKKSAADATIESRRPAVRIKIAPSTRIFESKLRSRTLKIFFNTIGHNRPTYSALVCLLPPEADMVGEKALMLGRTFQLDASA